jgi:hypothetical protein
LDRGLISTICKELKKLNIKNAINKWENEQTVLNILSYKGNANQNYTEILSHPVRMAMIKKTKQQLGASGSCL